MTHFFSDSVFAEARFWLLMLGSVVLPFVIYFVLMSKKAISRTTVLLLGFSLVAIAGFDVYVLRLLANSAAHTPSLVDDTLFVSEVSVAFYLLPALFAGLGINMISHVLTQHLEAAERRFSANERRERAASSRKGES
ncbi:hypothetical protein QTI66_28790 [Variovorax sp. J22R133]|uniref:hypothetical protein n=1 Tax=Variovorax brevis TaxID=3053503 RepID=UPI00257869A9|nr:hypothetical protein [Variovorax sp. J22R133]MDM0116169.1 hypothetical protein [Variovorax sp. J22R133]